MATATSLIEAQDAEDVTQSTKKAERFRKTVRLEVDIFRVVMITIYFTCLGLGQDWVSVGAPARQQTSLGTSAVQTPPPVLTLTMPAGGDSRRLEVDAGYQPSFTGEQFTVRYVYADGTPCTFGDTQGPCGKDGAILYYYVHDLSGAQNTVTYRILPIK